MVSEYGGDVGALNVHARCRRVALLIPWTISRANQEIWYDGEVFMVFQHR